MEWPHNGEIYEAQARHKNRNPRLHLASRKRIWDGSYDQGNTDRVRLQIQSVYHLPCIQTRKQRTPQNHA